jgi:hypothetical protein
MAAEISFDEFLPAPKSPVAQTFAGQLEPGNIDLHKRPVVHNPDGSISTVRSMSANFDGKEYLIPTVAADGSGILSDEDAIQQYLKTGQHLGAFDTPENATAYSQSLHEDQAKEYAQPAAQGAQDISFDEFLPSPVAQAATPVEKTPAFLMRGGPEAPTIDAGLIRLPGSSSIPPKAGEIVMDDGTTGGWPSGPSDLLRSQADNPLVRQAAGIDRGTPEGEEAAAKIMAPVSWAKNTLGGSFVEAGRAGLPMPIEAARLREAADLQQPQVQPQTPFQQHMAQQMSAPGIFQTPAEMQQRATRLDEEGAARLQDYRTNRLPELAAAEAVPSFSTAPTLPGQIAGALVSGASEALPTLASPEGFVPVGRGATVARTALKGAGVNAAVAGITDPVSQYVATQTGAQERYSPEQTLMAMGLGGVFGGALNVAPEAWAGAKGYMQRRNTAPRFPGAGPGDGPGGIDAEDLFNRTKAVSEQGQQLADDPEFQAQMVAQSTGTNLPPSQTIPQPGQRLTPEQYKARNRTESELGNLFNSEANIWPRDQVQVGPDGIEIPEGTQPVRDPTGRQATTDTLAPLREAEALLRKAGIEPDEDMMRTVAKYQESGLSPLGAVNAFKRARTMADREGMTPELARTENEQNNAIAYAKEMGIKDPTPDDLATVASYIKNGLSPREAINSFRRASTMEAREGMTPDLERAAGEKANSERFAKDAFDIADARRQRREAELDKWNPELEPDYSAGAGRADELTPRMRQDLATRLQTPAGVTPDQPMPYRSVDVISSKSVGGLRGEHIPGERPGGPDVPPQGREGQVYEGERTEPKLEGPAETAPPKQPAEAPAEAGPVRALGSDDILDRAFAKREQPAAQPDKPNVDHLSPDDQRRAVNLDHQIATAKAFDDPPDEIAALQREYDDLVNGKAAESAPEAKVDETPADAPTAPGTHPREVLDAIDKELAGTKWDIMGGRLNRDNEGKVSRSKWSSSNPDIHSVLTSYKVKPEQARNLVARSKSGKGKPLTERQQNIVNDLAKALSERKAPREPRPEPAPKAEPKAAKPERDPRLWQKGDDDPYPPKDASEEHIDGRQQRSFNRDYASSLNYAKESRAKADQLRREGASKNDQAAADKTAAEAERLLARQSELAPGRVDQFNKDFGLPPRSSKDIQAHHEKLKKIEQDFEADAARLKREGTAAEAKTAENRAIHAKANRVGWEKHHPELVGTPKEKAPDLELKSQTEAERAAAENDTKAKTKEQAESRKATEDKAQADKDRDDFKLSGSDRPADVATSHGQGTLLDIGAVPSKAGRPLKWLYRRLFHGDDKSSMSDVAKDLAAATRDLFGRESPTKRGVVKDAWRRYATDADSNLRSLLKPFKGDIGEQIADALHVQAGDKKGKGASLDERRQQQTNPREHKIEELDDWMRDNKINTPEAQAQIIKLVENPNTPRRGLLGEAAKKVEAFYKDMLAYQKEAGVDVGEVKGYFQRVLDNGKVAGHRGSFLKAAKKAYQQDNPRMTDADAQKAAEAYWEREVNGDIAKPGTPNLASGGATPSHMKARSFSKDAAKHLDDFYVKEIPAMMSSYLHRAVQRSEIAKSGVTIDGKHVPFGDNFSNWETITDAMRKQDPEVSGVLGEVSKLVATSAGISDSKLGSGVRNALGAVKTATTLGSMEKSALSSMTELLTPSLRASMGELSDIPTALKAMGEHAYNSVRNAVGGKSARTNKLQNTFDVAHAAGIVGGSGQHSLMAARASAGEPTQRATSAMLSKFFGRNGLEHLTNYQRATATGQAMDFLKRLSAPGRQGKAKTERFLGELGIAPKDQPAFTKFVRGLDGKHATPADLKGPMADQYKTAMLRFVDQAIQRPSASTRPAWASDPLGSTVFQLQSFNFAAQKNILNRMTKAMADKDLSVAERAKMGGSFMAHMAAMTGISAAVWEARDAAFSRPDSRKLTTGAKVERAMSGAGMFGKYDSALQAIGGGVRYGTSPLAAAGGPGLGNAVNLAKSLSDLSGPNNSPNTNTTERKAARTAYQVLGEPLLQAAMTPLKASPVGLGLTAVGVPKAGEALVDAMLPPKEGNKKELPPIESTFETIKNKFMDEDDGGRPKRAERPSRPQRASRPHN